MGFDKLLADLGGEPVLARSVRALAGCDAIEQIVIVAHASRLSEMEAIASPAALGKLRAVVAGGAQRHLSVVEGIKTCGQEVDFIAVHDGARPLVAAADLSAVILRARQTGAAALAHPVVETLKRADSRGFVKDSVDRTGLWAMETPQVFRADLLRRACDEALRTGVEPTDEVSAVHALGHAVSLVRSTVLNLKITEPADFELARRWWRD